MQKQLQDDISRSRMERKRLIVSWALKSCLSFYVQGLCSWSLLLLLQQKPADQLQRLFIPRSTVMCAQFWKHMELSECPAMSCPYQWCQQVCPGRQWMLGKPFPEVVQAAQPASRILPPPKLYNNHLDYPWSFIHCNRQSHHFFFICAAHASSGNDTLIYLVSKLFLEDMSFPSGTTFM